MPSISTIIFTCDNNSDLKEFIFNTCKNICIFGDIFIVNETKELKIPGTKDFLVGIDKTFKKKMVKALEIVKTDYVFVLLDDYYVFDSADVCYSNVVKLLKKYNPDYLKICKDYLPRSRTNRVEKELKQFARFDKYDLNFHPSIWKTKILLDCVKKIEKEEIGFVEAGFTKYAKTNNIKGFCLTRNKLPYDELIVSGKFFRQPYKKFCKNQYKGLRKKCSFLYEFKYKFRKFFALRLPSKVLNMLKKLSKNKSYYSN